LQAPGYFTKVGASFLRGWRRPRDEALSGVRVYTDEQPPREGARLRVEIFLPDGTSVICKTEVVWVSPAPEGTPALYDVGLAFIAINPDDRQRLAGVLEQAPAPI
jgi:hypothetical protein